MKFGQLIKKTEIFFLRNHTDNVILKLFPDSFLKNLTLNVPIPDKVKKLS